MLATGVKKSAGQKSARLARFEPNEAFELETDKRTDSRDILTAMDRNPHSVCWIGRNSSFRDELKRTCFDEVCIRIDGPRRTGVGESG